jgi:hypothetical protein
LADFYFNADSNSLLDNTLSILPNTNSHQIGFFLSAPKNEMFKELCILSSDKRDTSLYQDLGCNLLNMFLGSKKQIEEKFSTYTINVQQDVFYKFDHTQLEKLHLEDIFEQQIVSDEKVIGIHWYGGASLSQNTNNKINHENYGTLNNTVDSAIKYILG